MIVCIFLSSSFGITQLSLPSRALTTSTIIFTSCLNHPFYRLNCTSLRWEQPKYFSHAFNTKRFFPLQDPLNFKKTNSLENVEQFIEKIKKAGIVIEPKIDGFACWLVYKNGELKYAFTKHNKLKIMPYVHCLDCVPKKLNRKFSGLIRGELFVSHKAFRKINSRRIKSGMKIYKDTLGVLLGALLRRKKKDTSVNDNIQFFGYYVKYFKNPSRKQSHVPSQIDVHRYLRVLGFRCCLTSKFEVFRSAEKAMDYITNIESWRKSWLAPTDGVVVKVLQPDSCQGLGLEKMYPFLMYGFKFKSQIQNTKVISIKPVISGGIQMGAVVEIDPLKFSERTVRKVYVANRKVALLSHKKDVIAVGFPGKVPVLQKIITRESGRNFPTK